MERLAVLALLDGQLGHRVVPAERVAGAGAAVLRHRAARHLEEPGVEAIFGAQLGQPALQPDEDVLQDVLDVGRGDPLRQEGPQPVGDVGQG